MFKSNVWCNNWKNQHNASTRCYKILVETLKRKFGISVLRIFISDINIINWNAILVWNWKREKGICQRHKQPDQKAANKPIPTNGSYSLLTFIFHFKILPERNNMHGQNTTKYYRPHWQAGLESSDNNIHKKQIIQHNSWS